MADVYVICPLKFMRYFFEEAPLPCEEIRRKSQSSQKPYVACCMLYTGPQLKIFFSFPSYCSTNAVNLFRPSLLAHSYHGWNPQAGSFEL